RSSDFKATTRFVTAQAEKKVQLDKPGIYFWHVRALDKKNLPFSAYSAAYTLEFQRIYKDPRLIKNLMALYPKQQDSIVLVGTNKSEIEFQWTKPYKNALYRIELAYSPDFSDVFHSVDTKDNFYKYFEPFKARVVYWRVKA